MHGEIGGLEDSKAAPEKVQYQYMANKLGCAGVKLLVELDG